MLHYILTQGVSASLFQAVDRFSSEQVPGIRREGQGIGDAGEQGLLPALLRGCQEGLRDNAAAL